MTRRLGCLLLSWCLVCSVMATNVRRRPSPEAAHSNAAAHDNTQQTVLQATSTSSSSAATTATATATTATTATTHDSTTTTTTNHRTTRRTRRQLFRHRKLEWAPLSAAIEDEFLVVFYDDVDTATLQALWRQWRAHLGARITHTYASVNLKAAVLARVSHGALQVVLQSALVKYVEQNQVMHSTSSTLESFSHDTDSWGLDRVDQSTLPLDQSFSVQGSGNGVEVYVIDSGIQLDHAEFEGRAICGYNSFDDTRGTGCDDVRGHGSHVAGVVASKTWGVAKQATLVAVKALKDETGSGTLASVVGAVTYVCDEKTDRPDQPMIINMSISGSARTRALDEEVARCTAAGVIFVTSAGNSRGDACNYSPAAVDGSIAVGAVKKDDSLAAFSNRGPCVDVYAPGVQVKSVGIERATALKSGTSMAAPFVSGAAALYLQQFPTWTVEQVRDALIVDATVGQITGMDDDDNADEATQNSHNRLLNVANIGDEQEDTGDNNDGDGADDGGDQQQQDDNDGDSATGGQCAALLASCQEHNDCCGPWSCQEAFGICWFWG